MVMIKRITFICILVMLIVCGKAVQAGEEASDLTLIVVPDFSFQEVKWLRENGQFLHLWETSGMSGMNIRPDGPYSYLNSAVSLSTGVRALGIVDWNAYMSGEVVDNVFAEELYQQWTGNTVEEGVIFHPLLHKLVDKNNKVEIGIIGESLKQYGVSRYVIGNSDVNEKKVRYGPLFTMDNKGLTGGALTEATKKSIGAPSGVEMDVDNIYDWLSTIQEKDERSFTVIEWGDVFRLYDQKENMSEAYFVERYELSLINLEMFVHKLLTGDYVEDLMLLSPMVHSDAYQNKERLAPFFYWGKEEGVIQSYLLRSDTTRQDFVISNLDIAPTILNFYRIPQKGQFIGKPIQKEVINEAVLEEGLKNLDLMFLVFKSRNVVLSSYITLLVLLLIIVSLIILVKDKNETFKKIAKVLLISGVSSPLWFLITPYLLNYIQPNVYLLFIIFCSFLTGYLFVKLVRNPIFVLSGAIFISISVDLFFGNYFMQRSYLGYDPIIGARYYGIGNEFAGIYLISGLLLVQQRYFRNWFVLMMLALGTIIILSSTYLGANAGATISAGVMFGFFYYRYYFTDFQWRKLLIIISFVVPVVLAILFFTQLNGKESHIGYAFSKLFSGDFTYILDTIKRKLEMNWKIFRYSNWTQLFVTTYLLIALYLWRRKKIVGNEVKRVLIQTGVVASITLLIINDSGVVSAATSMFIIVCTSYYWALEEG
ncbi:hypothetical protein BKP35_04400 [Anaerobacillus arseniciselenatis]|uniref:Uncharacterized protein n=2 Tax=Anaerobacillus arseniciselenatis TaxID=85682 RepID=A0A1S2LVM5_9BACI|nr:hypothetical protein BKP35_04400 [Anaerobacillus arseniciselenatis]